MSSLAALCGVALPGTAMAQAELTLVRDMLRLDAERALEAERNRAGRPAPRAASAPVKQSDRIAVAAIYGVAGALRADVLVNGSRMHYQQGQPQARNATRAPGEFQLAKIDDLCVHLTRATERAPRVVCYAAQPVAGPGTGFTTVSTTGQSTPGMSIPVGTALGSAFGSGMSLPLSAPFPASGMPSMPPR